MRLLPAIRSFALSWVAATLLLGSFLPAQLVRAYAETDACDGAAEWLQLSEDRFRVFESLLVELLVGLDISAEQLVAESQDEFDQQQLEKQLDSFIENVPRWSEVAEKAIQDQLRSAPPSAARKLNNQLAVTLGSYAVAFEEMASLLAGVIDVDTVLYSENILEDIKRETDHVRRLAQSLKAECGLTSSGEFFNPRCYGEDALAWYERTNARAFDLSMLLDTSSSQDAIYSLRARQADDLPPPALARMQAIYLNFFDEIILYLQGASGEAKVLGNLVRIGEELESEKARLDIACADR
jgi:hypothetical protein